MKKIHLLTAIGICFMLLLSCKKDSNSIHQNLQTNLQQGSWSVDKLQNGDFNSTNEFRSYKIYFNADRSIFLKENNQTHYGEWSVANLESDNDNLSSLRLSVHFSLPVNLQKLNNTWAITTSRHDLIRLTHYNTADGTSDYLDLSKN